MSSPELQLAFQHHGSGRLEEAIGCYRRIIERQPDTAEAHLWLGDALAKLGRLDEAAVAIRRAITLSPAAPDAHNILGMILARQQHLIEAESSFRRAVALRPGFVAAHHNLGNALRELGRLEEAIASYQAALAIKGDLPSTYCSLGNCLSGLGRLGEAEAAYRKALAIKQNYPQPWLELANVCLERADPDRAATYAKNAIQLRPDMAEAYGVLASALLARGESEAAVESCRQALSLKRDCIQAHDVGLYAMLLSPKYEPQSVYEAHRAYADVFEAHREKGEKGTDLFSKSENRSVPFSPRRLRIGYVSPDFRQHSVTFFIEPLLQHHDRNGFEIFCYDHNAPALQDNASRRLAGHVEHWVSCHGLSDAELAQRVQTDGIEILVDLAGHTRGNRLPMFARKPAPVQVTYLGYPTTTGLSAMDYRLTSSDVDPQGVDHVYTERLYRLPRVPWCYRPPASAFDRDIVRAPQVPVTFGSMNNFAKLSRETVTLWGRLLQAIPDSRLVMTSVPTGSARDSLIRRLGEYGIHPDRLTLQGRLPPDQFGALGREIDVALDPFPYNGTTTTCESLWMGIPVITLIGGTSASRSGYALLKSVGLDELCARNPEEYIRIAIELAGDRARLNELRQELHRRFENSPLRDEAGFARDIENAYRTMWRARCLSKS